GDRRRLPGEQRYLNGAVAGPDLRRNRSAPRQSGHDHAVLEAGRIRDHDELLAAVDDRAGRNPEQPRVGEVVRQDQWRRVERARDAVLIRIGEAFELDGSEVAVAGRWAKEAALIPGRTDRRAGREVGGQRIRVD